MFQQIKYNKRLKRLQQILHKMLAWGRGKWDVGDGGVAGHYLLRLRPFLNRNPCAGQTDKISNWPAIYENYNFTRRHK